MKQKFADKTWHRLAQSRRSWERLGEALVQQWTSNCWWRLCFWWWWCFLCLYRAATSQFIWDNYIGCIHCSRIFYPRQSEWCWQSNGRNIHETCQSGGSGITGLLTNINWVQSTHACPQYVNVTLQMVGPITEGKDEKHREMQPTEPKRVENMCRSKRIQWEVSSTHSMEEQNDALWFCLQDPQYLLMSQNMSWELKLWELMPKKSSSAAIFKLGGSSLSQ